MVEQANLSRFMQAQGMDSFEALNERANQDPEGSHDALIRCLEYRFERPYARVLDLDQRRPFARWCVGGVTNVVTNCLDRWRTSARNDQAALVWEGEDSTVTTWTFADLDRETCRPAWGLRKLGIGRSDVVGMYLPALPHAAAAMLAVTKIGTIVLPMFSGFGAEAIDALVHCPNVCHVVVLRHLAAPHDWVHGRDHWWDELASDVPGDVADVATEPMAADAPFLLMFTSDTSGKPKGVVHSHCGFPIKTALDLSICMDLKAGDRFLRMSDMGWLVGPMLVFGGLLVGATVVLAEGAQNYPQPDRLWRLVERHRVTHPGLAPTIARLLMSLPDATLADRDLSSLRVMISTGEPWTPEACHWTFARIGKGHVLLLNFSGGTEMGGILTGTVIHPLKPCAFAGPVPGTGADVVNANSGESEPVGVTGELVMRTPTIGLPRTRNMKLMRRVARTAWLGEEAGNLSTLVNPEAVQAIRDARHAAKP